MSPEPKQTAQTSLVIPAGDEGEKPDNQKEAQNTPAADGVRNVLGNVRPKELTIDADAAGSVRGELELEPTQQAGMRLATGVGIVTTLIIIAIVVDWIVKSPSLGVPAGFEKMPEAQAKALTTNLKALNDIAVDTSVKMFDTIIARSLLPVFTAILGYIFGTRAAASKGS